MTNTEPTPEPTSAGPHTVPTDRVPVTSPNPGTGPGDSAEPDVGPDGADRPEPNRSSDGWRRRAAVVLVVVAGMVTGFTAVSVLDGDGATPSATVVSTPTRPTTTSAPTTTTVAETTDPTKAPTAAEPTPAAPIARSGRTDVPAQRASVPEPPTSPPAPVPVTPPPDVPLPELVMPVTVVDIVGLSATPGGSTPAEAHCSFGFQLVLSDGRTVQRYETPGFPGWETSGDVRMRFSSSGDPDHGAYPYTLNARGNLLVYEGEILSLTCRWGS